MRGFQDRVGFIWSVADEILRDDFKRSRYPDVILPFTVLRRVDCVLEPTKDKVLERYESLKGRLDNLHGPLAKTAGHFFYNVSEYTFARLLGGGCSGGPGGCQRDSSCVWGQDEASPGSAVLGGAKA